MRAEGHELVADVKGEGKPAGDGSRERGRPKGSKNAVDVLTVERPRCLACGSLAHSRYWGYDVKSCAGTDEKGRGYTYIRRRHCRCLACGRVRIEKEYLRSEMECAQRE
ncbi:MAG: hypothetical protein NTU94_13080 [Planctomycetota bacterium]|nr:hypothetical protein [Planctomycetota bacterium]